MAWTSARKSKSRHARIQATLSPGFTKTSTLPFAGSISGIGVKVCDTTITHIGFQKIVSGDQRPPRMSPARRQFPVRPQARQHRMTWVVDQGAYRIPS
jgi:hypothetical protein